MMFDINEDNQLYVAAFGTLLVAILLWKFLSSRNTSGKPLPPMAPYGMLETVQNVSSGEFPWFYLRSAAALDNTFTFRLNMPLPQHFIGTGDAAFAREVLLDPLTVKPKIYEQFEPDSIGSIFTRNGSFWHARRKGTAPAFSSSHIKRMNQVALDCTGQWIQENLLTWAKEGKSFDVAEEMISITLDSISKTAFDYEMSEQEKKDFLFNNELISKEFLSKSISNPFRKFLGRLLPERKRAIECSMHNRALSLRMIKHYHSLTNPTKGTIIDLIANNSCYKNEVEQAVDLLVYLIAGHDTTAYTMAFTLLLLAKHPEEQDKVRADLAKYEPQDWSKSEKLQMAIRESMRLLPVSASGSLRQTGRDFVTKEGFFVPKNSNVSIAMILLHRNPAVFENPDKFIPSRWENPTKEMKDAFLIFSAGKQNCIGQSLANAELHCIIPKILSEVKLEVEEEGICDYFLTLKPVGALLKATPV